MVLQPTATDPTLHSQIERFYAAQMQLLDRGAVREWADTFTEDGVFAANGLPMPVRGRETIATSAERAYAERTARGVVHRHWLGMLVVDPESEDRVRARAYALVIEVPVGGDPVLHRSTVCTDLLVREDGRWLVRERLVTRDDLPATD
jgi:uncharacterized protein (TIGR02246 family)